MKKTQYNYGKKTTLDVADFVDDLKTKNTNVVTVSQGLQLLKN